MEPSSSGRRSVLITGVHGCIGTHLWERLRRHFTVWGLDEKAGPCENFVQGDLCDPRCLSQSFQGSPFAVFHLAARPGVRWCEQNASECWRTNVLGTGLLLEEAAKHDCVQHIIFASSSTVYGDMPVPWSEGLDVRCAHLSSVYARSKRMGEQLVSAYSSPRVRVTICRLFSVHGPRMRSDMAPAQFLHRIDSGMSVHVHDSDVMRDFTFIGDVVSGFEKCIGVAGSQLEVVNFAHGQMHSIAELVAITERVLQKRAHTVAGEARPEDLRVTLADTAHAMRVGVGPFPTTLADGVSAAATSLLTLCPLFVVALIATCPGRRELLHRALDSVASQTRPPDLVLIVLDVPECEEREKLELELHCTNRATWRQRLATVENVRTAQCASGSWNSGILALLQAFPAAVVASVFVAILDDDDAWLPHHLEQCVAPCRVLPGADVVVSGIVRVVEGGVRTELSVPKTLSVTQFLVGNPHVQGSNMFIRLSVLLHAGLFDENLPSCTDRDLMIRVLDLGNVRVASMPARHSVIHHAEAGRLRLSSPNSVAKHVGLARFWDKYRDRMSLAERDAFLTRANTLFGWMPTAVAQALSGLHDSFEAKVEPEEECGDDGSWIVIGITSDSTRDTVAPLLGDLLRIASRGDVIILENGPRGESSLDGVAERARQQGLRCSVISLEQQARDHHLFPSWIAAGSSRRRSIAETRTMLQYYCFGVAAHLRERFCLSTDVPVLILDDDKRLSSFSLSRLLSHGAGALLGFDISTPPLPAASMIRTQAVDVLHNLQRLLSDSKRESGDRRNPTDMPDYYHDLSESHFKHLECPFWMPDDGHTTLESLAEGFQRALCGCAVTRPLVSVDRDAIQLASIERGGSTLVFDLRMLLVPNTAPQFDGRFSRRSDMLWAIKNAEAGRFCVRSTQFAVTHERLPPQTPPSFDELARSVLDDLLGAASVRGSQQKMGTSAGDTFSSCLLARATRLRANVYRIYGVVQSIRSLVQDASLVIVCNQAARLYDPEIWDKFLQHTIFDRCRELQHQFEVWLQTTQQPLVVGGIDRSLADIGAQVYAHHRKLIALQHLRSEMPSATFQYVAMGGEGVVYRSGANAFKYLDGVLLRSGKMHVLEKKLMGAVGCVVLNLPLEVVDGRLLMRTRFIPASGCFPNGADRGHLMRQVFDFVGECRRLQIVCNNVSKHNFLVTDQGGMLHFVDFGIDIGDWTVEGETRMLRRLLLLMFHHDQENLAQLMRNSLSNALMPELSELPLFCQAMEAHLGKQLVLDDRDDDNLQVGTITVRNPFFDESARPMHVLERAISRAGLCLAENPESVPSVSIPDLLPNSNRLSLSLKPQAGDALPPSSLVIRVCAMDARTVYARVTHLIRSLLAPCDLCTTERVVIVDAAKTGDFVRPYDEPQMELLRGHLEQLKKEKWIDRVEMATLASIDLLYQKWFGIVGTSQSHALDGTTVALGLKSIECARPESELLLLVDSDIMVGRNDPTHSLFREAQSVFANDATRVAWAVNVYGCRVFPVVNAARFESRASVVHRPRLTAKLPLAVGPAPFAKGYHRLFDIGGVTSVRGGNAGAVYFVHPTNDFKRDHSNYMLALGMIERAHRLPPSQLGNVDLSFDIMQQTTLREMLLTRSEPMVVVVCGRVKPGQFLRCMSSLEQQTFRGFGVVLVDDANESYATREFIRRYVDDERRLPISLIQPYARRGSLANHVLAIRTVCQNPESIICSVDADDWLANEHVLQRVWDVYTGDPLVEVAVGGMYRADKNCTYAVTFEDARRKRGGNVWSHLKTFRKYMFDRIRDADLRSSTTGSYFDLASDWAMMLPMVEMATRCAEFRFPTYIYNGTSLNRLARNSRICEIVAKPPYARRRYHVAVVGHARITDDEQLESVCVELGLLLAECGFVIVNGGLGGVMEYVARGARLHGGDVVGIIPGSDSRSSNPFVTVALATSMDHARNAIVALADAVVVLGGGAGTHSEVALAWSNRRLIVALRSTGGTAAQVAGRPMDGRIRYRSIPDDMIFAADSVQQVIQVLEQKLPLYGKRDQIK